MTMTLELEDSIARAAKAAGIALGYFDALGKWRDVPRDTVLAVLAAMGLDPTCGDIAREISRRHRDAPLAVVTEAKDWRIVAATARDAGPCSIATESGEVIPAELTPRRILSAKAAPGPGYHRLTFGRPSRELGLAVCPARCYWPEWMERGERRWGLAAQIYTLRGETEDGIGDFGDLAELMNRLGKAGGDAVLINPVTAGFLAQPHRKSPYQASDRRFLNPLMIDCGPGGHGRGLIDYPRVVPERLSRLRRMFDALSPSELRECSAWREQAPGALAGFAQWEAQSLSGGSSPSQAEIAFHEWLQYRADRELGLCASTAASRDMATGVIRDLPVGPAQDGFETLSQRAVFARDVDVGAPPDLLAPKGQNWGIAAYNPIALADAGFAPLIALLRANMRHAGGLRIDHVMSLSRLFWIPRGATAGTYVQYPFAELAALACLESVRARCMVIGEDLGTVPPGLRAQLRARGMLSTKVVSFERRRDGGLLPPSRYPYSSLAATSTHDMPTFRAWWRSSGPADRETFAKELQRTVKIPLGGKPQLGFRASFLRLFHFLGRSKSALRLVRLEDVALERRAINVPGTGDEQQNWSLRLRCRLRELLDSENRAGVWCAIIKAMQSSR
jgi:4-alpha-glucanotransferase